EVRVRRARISAQAARDPRVRVADTAARSCRRATPEAQPDARARGPSRRRGPRLAFTMRIVMTLMVRDEADIIDLQIAYHLAAGVDFVIVTDHESEDGTSEVLERYARQGVLHRIPVTSPFKRQAEWVTRM